MILLILFFELYIVIKLMILVIRLLLFIVVLFASDGIFRYLLLYFRQGWLIKYVLSLHESFLKNKIKNYLYLFNIMFQLLNMLFILFIPFQQHNSHDILFPIAIIVVNFLIVFFVLFVIIMITYCK